MNTSLKQELFSRGILVSETEDLSPENAFSAAVALGQKFNIRITKGIEHANEGTIMSASYFLGEYVPEPFYRGFPDSVRALTPNQKFYDQCYHYAMTYGLGFVDKPGHSIFEKDIERTMFQEEAEVKDFIIVPEDEARTMVLDILSGYLKMSRPLDPSHYEKICTAISEYGTDFVPDEIPCLETAVELIVRTEDTRYAKDLMLSDVIKLVEFLINFRYEYVMVGMKMNKLNLRNKDRKMIAKIIHMIIDKNRVDLPDCFAKRKKWVGLLHHIHFKPDTMEEKKFVDLIRSPDTPNLSIESLFERTMASNRPCDAAECLVTTKGSGALIRNLNYILSRCKSDEEMKEVLSCLEK